MRQKLLELGWEQKKLFAGDFWLHTYNFTPVTITRKTVSDLLNSISHKPNPGKPGRKEKSFGQQLEEILEMDGTHIILLEGSWATISPTQQLISARGIEYYSWDMVWNFLRTWQDRGFSLELTANEGHTIQRLNALYSYYMKPSHTGGLSKHNIIGDPRLLALQCGGIGQKYGQALLNHFGSLWSIANASIKDFLEVEGIGEKRAESLAIHFRKGTKQAANPQSILSSEEVTSKINKKEVS